MNGYVSELFARERAADFEREADKTALIQLAKRTTPPARSRVGRGRRQILSAVKSATERIHRPDQPADRPQQGSAVEA